MPRRVATYCEFVGREPEPPLHGEHQVDVLVRRRRVEAGLEEFAGQVFPVEAAEFHPTTQSASSRRACAERSISSLPSWWTDLKMTSGSSTHRAPKQITSVEASSCD
jgi:hypothetical protein